MNVTKIVSLNKPLKRFFKMSVKVCKILSDMTINKKFCNRFENSNILELRNINIDISISKDNKKKKMHIIYFSVSVTNSMRYAVFTVGYQNINLELT